MPNIYANMQDVKSATEDVIPISIAQIKMCIRDSDYAGQPWKAQYWLRQVMDRMYSPTPDGYCGDEDNGQTSAWYVFSALGFYPVCPGTDEYIIGCLLYTSRAELNKNNGRLTVKQVDAKLDAVWHDNLIPFQKADIFTITKALERFYDVKIILSPDIQTGKTYSGVLKRKSNIESVLKSLQNSIPIDYKIVGNNIFISPK